MHLSDCASRGGEWRGDDTFEEEREKEKETLRFLVTFSFFPARLCPSPPGRPPSPTPAICYGCLCWFSRRSRRLDTQPTLRQLWIWIKRASQKKGNRKCWPAPQCVSGIRPFVSHHLRPGQLNRRPGTSGFLWITRRAWLLRDGRWAMCVMAIGRWCWTLLW